LKEVELTNGGKVLVDDDDFDVLSRSQWFWSSPKKTKYAFRLKDNIRMHRILLDAKENEIVDHVNGDGLDNRRANLRFVTPRQNAQNKRPKIEGMKGVEYDKPTDMYRARIRKEGQKISLGYYRTAREAAVAYNGAAKSLFGEYAWTNDLSMEPGERNASPAGELNEGKVFQTEIDEERRIDCPKCGVDIHVSLRPASNLIVIGAGKKTPNPR